MTSAVVPSTGALISSLAVSPTLYSLLSATISKRPLSSTRQGLSPSPQAQIDVDATKQAGGVATFPSRDTKNTVKVSISCPAGKVL